MAEKKEPLLLLDNSTMYVIGAGDYHSTNLTFEEAKAIIDMYQTEDILRCFTDRATEQVLHDFVGIEPRDFAYKPIRKMRVGQDAIGRQAVHHPLGNPARGGSHRRRPCQKDSKRVCLLPIYHPCFLNQGDTVPPPSGPPQLVEARFFLPGRKGTGTQEKIQKLFKIS